MNKTQKIEVLENLTNQLKVAKSATVVDYKGMTMTDLQTLRESLSAVGGSLNVVKNTLLKIALEKSIGKSDDLVIDGPTALILSHDDEIAPLQALAKYLKTKELPALKFGVFEGKLVNTQDLTTLSKLPGKQTLYEQLVGSLAGPVYGLVGALQGNLQKLVYILNVHAQQAK